MEKIIENKDIVDIESLYDDMLDDTYGVVSIAGMEYSTSDVLKRLDPIAYRCGLDDYIDSLLTDGEIEEIDGDYYATR
jgi:hypothetical protein